MSLILLLDTSTPTCRLTVVIDGMQISTEWEAARELGKGLLGYLEAELARHEKTWQDITGLGIYRGPGSFTGLRIGITVLNTLAQSLDVPIIGATGDDWQAVTLNRLAQSENDHIVLPEYGAEAHITKPKK